MKPDIITEMEHLADRLCRVGLWLSLAIGIVLLMASCSTAGGIGKSGEILAPTSLLGEQSVEGFYARSAVGELRIKSYSTHNPDRELTRTGQTWIRWSFGTKMFNRGADSADIVSKGNAAVNLKSAPVGANPNVIPVNPNTIPK